jgi:hypothetical protein
MGAAPCRSKTRAESHPYVMLAPRVNLRGNQSDSASASLQRRQRCSVFHQARAPELTQAGTGRSGRRSPT